MLSTLFSSYPEARNFSGQRLWFWQLPPPKYMCRLENDDLDMLCMVHGYASMCWLLFTSFHWSNIESFQSRLICVCRVFHVVTDTQLNIRSSNSNPFVFKMYSPLNQEKKYYPTTYIKLKEGDDKVFILGLKGKLISACKARKKLLRVQGNNSLLPTKYVVGALLWCSLKVNASFMSIIFILHYY